MKLESIFGISIGVLAILLVITFKAWLGAREDLAAQIERCNSEKLAAVAEAESLLRDAQRDAYAARIAELEALAESEARARVIAEEAAQAARERPERVRTVIRESTDACVDAIVPADITGSLRD